MELTGLAGNPSGRHLSLLVQIIHLLDGAFVDVLDAVSRQVCSFVGDSPSIFRISLRHEQGTSRATQTVRFVIYLLLTKLAHVSLTTMSFAFDTLEASSRREKVVRAPSNTAAHRHCRPLLHDCILGSELSAILRQFLWPTIVHVLAMTQVLFLYCLVTVALSLVSISLVPAGRIFAGLISVALVGCISLDIASIGLVSVGSLISVGLVPSALASISLVSVGCISAALVSIHLLWHSIGWLVYDRVMESFYHLAVKVFHSLF